MKGISILFSYTSKRSPRINHIYLQAAVMAMGPASTLGFARFSYSLLLPAMAKTLHWNYQKLGTLNTVNALGYLTGAFTATPISNKFGAKKTFIIALVIVVLMGALSGASANFAVISLARMLSGLGAGVAFVTGGSLISAASSNLGAKITAVALGIYYAGAGVGIVLSGLTLPFLLSHLGSGAWKAGWLLMAFFSFLSVVLAGPQALSLVEPPKHTSETKVKRKMRGLEPSVAAYALFGAGYISFITFLIAFMKSEGDSTSTITWFWTVLGVSTIASGPIWGRLLSRLRGGLGFACVLFVATIGTSLPLITKNFLVLMISAFLFGVSLMSTTTAVTLIAQRNLDPRSVGSAIGIFTTAIAAGQIVGPVTVGTLSDTSRGLKLGILASLIMIFVSTLISLLQKDHIRPSEPVVDLS